MNNIIKGALVANAASLGFHWIYDSDYIKKISLNESIVFLPQKKHHYESAKKAYLSYEGLPVGALSMQGYLLRGLYPRLKKNPDFNQEDYDHFIFSHLKPGGVYQGYVESYVNQWIAFKLSQQFDLQMPPLKLHDEHLVGLMPYLAVKALGYPQNKAWELARLFTDQTIYLDVYTMLDTYFDTAPKVGLQAAIKAAIQKSPPHLKALFEEAINTDNTEAFVMKHDLMACEVHKALPVAFHVAYHAKAFDQAIIDNMKIGGNLSDRGAIIGAMLSAIYEIPQDYLNRTVFEVT